MTGCQASFFKPAERKVTLQQQHGHQTVFIRDDNGGVLAQLTNGTTVTIIPDSSRPDSTKVRFQYPGTHQQQDGWVKNGNFVDLEKPQLNLSGPALSRPRF